MSGMIGNGLEPKMRKLLSRLLGPDMLGSKYGEFNIALLHFMEEFSLMLIFNIIAISFYRPVALIGMVAVTFLILIHEWPTEGRRIDVITRGFGQFIGAILGIFILKSYWYVAVGIEFFCLINLVILFFNLKKDEW